MEVDKAAQATIALEENAPKDDITNSEGAPDGAAGGDEATN